MTTKKNSIFSLALLAVLSLWGCSTGQGLVPHAAEENSTQVTPVCTTPLQATITPSASSVNVNAPVTWTVLLSGCTGNYIIKRSGYTDLPSRMNATQFTVTYPTVNPNQQELVVAQSVDAVGSVLQQVSLTGNINVTSVSSPTLTCSVSYGTPASGALSVEVDSMGRFVGSFPTFSVNVTSSAAASITQVSASSPVFTSIDGVPAPTTPSSVTISPRNAGITLVTFTVQGAIPSSPAPFCQVLLSVNTITRASLVIENISPSNFSGISANPVVPPAACVLMRNVGGMAASNIQATLSNSNFAFRANPACVNPCTASLAPSATCTYPVAFLAPVAGNLSANLAVAYTNDGSALANNANAQGTISGSAVLPPARLIVSNNFPPEFVNVPMNPANPPVACINIMNNGASPATNIQMSIGLYFTRATTGCSSICANTLAAGASCNVPVTFYPTVIGTLSSGFNISYNSDLWVLSTLNGSAITPPGSWVAFENRDCVSSCQSISKVNVASPEGMLCASGENRPAISGAGINYRFGTYAGTLTSADSRSYGGRCYRGGQKQDSDATDLTVACFCR